MEEEEQPPVIPMEDLLGPPIDKPTEENLRGKVCILDDYTHDEIKALAKKNPFKGVKDEKPNYLIVTFFKNKNCFCT